MCTVRTWEGTPVSDDLYWKLVRSDRSGNPNKPFELLELVKKAPAKLEDPDARLNWARLQRGRKRQKANTKS